MNLKREPVIIANSIAALISALIVAAVALGYLDWDAEQQAAVMAVVVAAVNVIAGIVGRALVTPVASPRDDAGAPLTRADGTQAYKR